MLDNKTIQSINSGDDSVNLIVGGSITVINQEVPTPIIDNSINEAVNSLKKSRFFTEYNRTTETIKLGKQLIEGDFSKGTNAIRMMALAWCARILSHTEYHNTAKDYLIIAKNLGTCEEIIIADAFLSSHEGDKNTALSMLNGVNSPTARSAAFMVVNNRDGGESALEWLAKVKITPAEMDSEGKFFLLSIQLELGHWEETKNTLESINENDFIITPALYHACAMAQLLTTVPIDFRSIILKQLPLEAKEFPLASDSSSMISRRIAQKLFCDAASVSRKLGLYNIANTEDDFALWLDLKDVQNFERGMSNLEAKLRNQTTVLRLVPLGINYGIKLDLEAIHNEIERQIALNGGITQDTAIARLGLMLAQATPIDAAHYINKYYDELSPYIDRKTMQILRIEFFSRGNLVEKAKECLHELLNEGISEIEESRLRRIIAEAEGADPLETRKAQFKKSNSLTDLKVLIDELEERNDLDGLCSYGEILFNRTRSIPDAELVAKSLNNANKSEQLIIFLRNNSDILSQSKILRLINAWALFREGLFLEARSKLVELTECKDDKYYRSLDVNINLAIGDWNSISNIISQEYTNRDNRSAYDLIETAKLATTISPLQAKDLILSAVAKANNDPVIFTAAYFLATSAGWEDNINVSQWLQKAAKLSRHDGPIQRMTLKDIYDLKPDWDRRQSETWNLLSRGDISMCMAAQSINRSLIFLTLFPALTNITERDPRKRNIIPVYSGVRQPSLIDLKSMTISLDAASILTFGFLNILDKVIDTAKEVHLPHSTLLWLFKEKQKSTFHQPSRIKDAYTLQNLLATGKLERLTQTIPANSDLSMLVGDNLSILISEAKNIDPVPGIVIRPYPVHRVSSFMEEEVDLTEYQAVLSSCLSVVRKLRDNGQITADEEKRATSYLQLHEEPWPNEPEIKDGTVIYLDDVTVSYFLHLNILEKLHDSGFKTYIPPSEISEINQFIAYEGISGRVNIIIDQIRNTINSRIETEKIKFWKNIAENQEDVNFSAHQINSLINFAHDCDAVISDDRFLNQHQNIANNQHYTPIYTSIDIIDSLASSGVITESDVSEHKTLLRRAGYSLFPTNESELIAHLNNSSVKDKSINENAELKAIRENLLLLRMRDWLQLPKEALWLDTTFKALINSMKHLWKENINIPETVIRSNWIIDLVDIRGWSHSLAPESRNNVIEIGRGAQILMLLSPPTDIAPKIRNAYWNWVEDVLLKPLKEQFPDIYKWIIQFYVNSVNEIVHQQLPNKADDHE